MQINFDIKKLKMLYKEIEVIKDDFDSLIYTINANNGRSVEIDKITKAKDKAVERYLKKYNDFNNEIDKITDSTMREIIRLRIKGLTYDKIGYKIGYTPSAVFKKEKDFILNPMKYLKVKEIRPPKVKQKGYTIFDILNDLEKGK